MQSTIFDRLLDSPPSPSSGKMYPESSATTPTGSAVSWARWQEVVPHSSRIETQAGQTRVWSLDRAASLLGVSSMPSTSEWPNDDAACSCSLAEVLERGPLPTRYYLSAKACAGILRRAEKRGKALPPALHRALTAASLRDASPAETGGGQRYDAETETLIATSGISPALRAQSNTTNRADSMAFVAHSLRGEGFDASEDGTGRVTPLVPICFGAQMSTPHWQHDIADTLQAKNPKAVSVALRGREGGATAELGDDKAGTLWASKGGGDKAHALAGMAVRRLTPGECETLQGLPRGYTAIPGAADGPRYKAIGNGMAVPCVSWIGKRLEVTR